MSKTPLKVPKALQKIMAIVDKVPEIGRKGVTMIKVGVCEGCEGTGCQMNEYGMIRMCPECNSDAKTFFNQYGEIYQENPTFYVDEEKKILAPVDKRKDYILLPDGTAIDINT